MEKNFNHSRAEVADKIALIGELEHAQRHARRSAIALLDTDEDRWVFYSVKAIQFKRLRRKLQSVFFPDIADYDWCLCKTTASIRQLSYEIDMEDKLRGELDDIVDEMWGYALNMDLSDCVACKEDKDAGQEVVSNE